MTVSVASNAPSGVTNQVTASGGGSTTASASDATAVNPPPSGGGRWAKIYSIAIDRTKAGSSTQSSFPVFVYASDASLKDVAHGGQITSSGTVNGVMQPYDLVFATSTSLGTYLPWEVASWDNVNGVLYAWVQVPALNGSGASSNTTFAAAPFARLDRFVSRNSRLQDHPSG